MNYVPPFDLIRRTVEITTVRGDLRVNLSYDDFVNIVKQLLAGVQVDEEWYLRTYEDIGKAVRDGVVRSARQHFIEDGYFEGRLPAPIRVNERWYVEQYPDVADSIRNGAVPSAQAHFDGDGYREGRLPFGV